MALLESLNVGIVGVGGRGPAFKFACDALQVRIHAVCDTDPQRLQMAGAVLGADEYYDTCEAMLAASDLDAVIVSTPMQLHARQAIAALEIKLSADEVKSLEEPYQLHPILGHS